MKRRDIYVDKHRSARSNQPSSNRENFTGVKGYRSDERCLDRAHLAQVISRNLALLGELTQDQLRDEAVTLPSKNVSLAESV